MLLLLQGVSNPEKVFDRTPNLENTQIINYRVDEGEKWCVLIGIAPGAPERCAPTPYLSRRGLTGKQESFKMTEQQVAWLLSALQTGYSFGPLSYTSNASLPSTGCAIGLSC